MDLNGFPSLAKFSAFSALHLLLRRCASSSVSLASFGLSLLPDQVNWVAIGSSHARTRAAELPSAGLMAYYGYKSFDTNNHKL
ncbi:hypothetical protein CTA1_10406 [Colletotrichum tanaceti]|uniref:Uncharacterized protein n=1 Tax=Colletotrichum tanaceti TaxID=1306861 RepID=A0A4U6XUS7_9PEZI|nr:hypothetical protein CTA1_10406 [Colletotrichum tanaceti]